MAYYTIKVHDELVVITSALKRVGEMAVDSIRIIGDDWTLGGIIDKMMQPTSKDVKYVYYDGNQTMYWYDNIDRTIKYKTGVSVPVVEDWTPEGGKFFSTLDIPVRSGGNMVRVDLDWSTERFELDEERAADVTGEFRKYLDMGRYLVADFNDPMIPTPLLVRKNEEGDLDLWCPNRGMEVNMGLYISDLLRATYYIGSIQE